jgi:hypothetical protein
MKKLHALVLKVPTSDKDKYLKRDRAQIKVDQAEQILAAEKEDKKTQGPVNVPLGAEAPAGTPAPPDAPKGDLAPATIGAKGSAPGQAPPDQPNQPQTAAAAPRGAAGTMARMMGMGGMRGMMGAGMRGMSPEGADRQMRPEIAALAADLASRESDPKSKAILKKLDEPISMSFAEPTPLEDVLRYIKQATTTATSSGIPIYVDPKGLKEATPTPASQEVMLNLEGVPLKTTLRLMLKQIGLAYCVRDGVLIISSVQGVNEELNEAQNELDAVQTRQGGFGGMGGMGGGMR